MGPFNATSKRGTCRNRKPHTVRTVPPSSTNHCASPGPTRPNAFLGNGIEVLNKSSFSLFFTYEHLSGRRRDGAATTLANAHAFARSQGERELFNLLALMSSLRSVLIALVKISEREFAGSS